MGAEFEIDISGMAAVATAVRKLGDDRTITNEMVKEIKRAVPPVRKSVRSVATAEFPKRGGLNKWVARASVTGQIRRGPRVAGITIRASRKSTKDRAELRKLDTDGTLRHPLWGNRGYWYPQTVNAGWFAHGVEAQFEEFTEAANAAINAAIEKVGM